MSTTILPTVAVIRLSDGAEAVINESEFDPALHERANSDTGSKSKVLTVDEQRAKFIAEQLAQKAADVIEKVQKAPADALDVLKAMRAAEAADKKRSTVLDAIDAQITKLTAPQT